MGDLIYYLEEIFMIQKERLDKILSNMGYGSRKIVKKYIKDGLVKVNEEIILNSEYKVNPYEESIFLRGEEILYRKYIYLMMNKPQGLVSSTDDPHTRTVIDLLDDEYLIYKPFPAGRLDKDTEGLMFITNDGQLTHELLSPKKGINKTYYADINGFVEEKHIDLFKNGIVLDDGYKTLPANLEIIESDVFSKVLLTIQEGKFHQVKRMFQSLDMSVIYLKRISIGNLKLDPKLNLGEYRELTEEELNLLKKR